MARRAVSFTGRSFIIVRYAPRRADKVVERINSLAKAYWEGRLTKREYLARVKRVLLRAGLTEREWRMIYRKIKARNQV